MIDFSGEGHNCQVAPLGHVVGEATALTYNGLPLICGGQKDGAVTNECYVYKPSTQAWDLFGTMSETVLSEDGVQLGPDSFIIDGKLYICSYCILNSLNN